MVKTNGFIKTLKTIKCLIDILNCSVLIIITLNNTAFWGITLIICLLFCTLIEIGKWIINEIKY